MTSPAKFYHVIQIILHMYSCDQSLVTVAFLWEKLSQTQLYQDLTRKTAFFQERSWFRFNNLGLALSTNLKFYASVAKGLNLKVRKFWGLIPTFVEVTGENLAGRPFCPHPQSWVGLNGQCGLWPEIRVCIPQGSILKPSFLIYIDVLSNGFKTKCKLFADDTSLFFVVHNVDTSANDLNHELQKTQFNADPSKQAQETIFSSKKSCFYSPSCLF